MTTMQLAPAPAEKPAYSDLVAAQIRGVLGQLNLTKHDLGVRLGENDVWIGRRLASGVRRVPIDLNDLARMAEALNVPVSALLPRLDSNQQPAGKRGRWLRAVRDDDAA